MSASDASRNLPSASIVNTGLIHFEGAGCRDVVGSQQQADLVGCPPVNDPAEVIQGGKPRIIRILGRDNIGEAGKSFSIA